MSHSEVTALRTELAFIRAEMTKLGAQAQVTQMAVAETLQQEIQVVASINAGIIAQASMEGDKLIRSIGA